MKESRTCMQYYCKKFIVSATLHYYKWFLSACVQLFYRYSCDLMVVRLMRERTMGNSSTKLQKQVAEQHTESHMNRALQFLQAREPFEIQSSKGLFQLPCPAQNIPPLPPIPKPDWFLAVYLRDVITRLDETKARITSVFGEILKMDSTKKV